MVKSVHASAQLSSLPYSGVLALTVSVDSQLSTTDQLKTNMFHPTRL